MSYNQYPVEEMAYAGGGGAGGYGSQQFKPSPYGSGRQMNRSPRSSEHGGYPGGDAGGQGGYGGGYSSGGPRGGGGAGGGYQNGGGNSGNTLWMGNIDENMDEQFITYAFSQAGVVIQQIKIIRNKETGLPIGYGFVTFENATIAQSVLLELNGKKIPNVEDDKRFFLKPANRQGGGGGGGMGGGGGAPGQRPSIFVGNLTPDIDDEILHAAFITYYPSVASAKVITADGQSKGYGFVSFEDPFDYNNALANPNMMLGTTPITISRARQNNGGGRGGLDGQKNPRYSGEGGGRGGPPGGDMRGGAGGPRRQPY